MKHKETLRAIHLIKTFHQHKLKGENFPERITLLNDYSMEAYFNNGNHNTRAIFGMYDHSRQLADFINIYDRTRQSHRVISHINLIPKKNIPVKFAGAPVLIRPIHN